MLSSLVNNSHNVLRSVSKHIFLKYFTRFFVPQKKKFNFLSLDPLNWQIYPRFVNSHTFINFKILKILKNKTLSLIYRSISIIQNILLLIKYFIDYTNLKVKEFIILLNVITSINQKPKKKAKKL